MKDYSYEVTTKDVETGKTVVHNIVNKARGYGKSCFKEEKAARKRLENDLRWFNSNPDMYVVIDWVLTKCNVVIDRMEH